MHRLGWWYLVIQISLDKILRLAVEACSLLMLNGFDHPSLWKCMSLVCARSLTCIIPSKLKALNLLSDLGYWDPFEKQRIVPA